MLAGAEDVVALVAALLHPALDLPGRPQRDADLRHHEPDRALGARDRGHDRIGPAVLGRDHVAVGAQVTKRELRRPRRVVDLHGHEGDLEIPRQALRLVEVDGRWPRLEGIMRSGDRDALLPDGFDVLRPGIDQRDVVPRP